jgi:quinol---cytochrome c reductase iron-sulfur subunit, bacillus type
LSDSLSTHDTSDDLEVSRRTFMAGATLTIGGIVGLVLAIPIVGSLLPPKNASEGSWAPLSSEELGALQKATDKPVKLTFTLKYKDDYLPEQSAEEYAWGIKIDLQKFRAARPDIFDVPGADGDLTYPPVTMGFVVFSPICPHLGCYYNWSDDQKKFMCPCHGSQYTFDGTHVAGPAPRGLDPLPLRSRNGTAEVTWIVYQPNTPQRIVVSYQA